MSKLQFIALLSPGVGSFVLVLVAWLQSNYRLGDLKESMNQRFNSVDERFNRVDERFNRMEVRLDRIESDQKQFYVVTGKLDGRMDELSRK